jgi:peptidoglycan/LPS O-acetylase OafA/YrhL
MKHLPAIDGLRAIAVLAVVAYHAGLPVPAGFVGVDVFFVISGYVITRMLATEHAQTGRIDFAAFYARRVRRILPALVVVVVATVAASMILLVPDYQAAVARSAMAAMGMVANVYFQSASGGYFDSASNQMPLLHLWSLGVEEQFYLVWPLLLAWLLRTRHASRALAFLAAASFVLAQWLGTVSPSAEFYQMPPRFWELAIGGLIALSPECPRRWAAPMGMALLMCAVLVQLPVTFPGVGALPAVAGAALVLLAVHGGLRVRALEFSPLRGVGLISYSLYLWHWPLLALLRSRLLDAPPLPLNLALCLVAVVLATLSYRYVETPLRRRALHKPKAITVGVATCLVMATAAGAVNAHAQSGGSLSARTAQDFPANQECNAHADAPAALPPASCGNGDVIVWGDSHAYAWQPYAARFGTVYPLTREGCEPSAGDPHGDLCDQFNAIAVERAKRGRVVLLGGYWLRRFGEPGMSERVRNGVASALAALAPHVERIIVMGPLPVMPYTPQKCLQEWAMHACAMARDTFDREAAVPRAFLQAQARKYSNVVYIDPADFFCTATVCPMMRDGYSLYWDTNHISASAARHFR